MDSKIIGVRDDQCLSEMWGGRLGCLLVMHSRRPPAWRILRLGKLDTCSTPLKLAAAGRSACGKVIDAVR
jgi:hypothetical protein